MGVQHQRMPQPIVGGKKHGLMVLAKASFIDTDPGIRLHDGSTKAALHFIQFQLAAQGAKKAFAVQLHGVPNGDGVQVISHG